MAGCIGVSSAEQGRHTAFWAQLWGLQMPEPCIFVSAAGANIAGNRNLITAEAIKSSCDWVLYLDDDHLLPLDVVPKLLKHNVDVVSAFYTQREPPFAPVIFSADVGHGFVRKNLTPKDRGLITCAAAGAGCLLVRRPAMEALGTAPWTLGQIEKGDWGDDLDYCRQLMKAGFQPHCDLDTRIGHFMTVTVVPDWDEKQGWVTRFAHKFNKETLGTVMQPLGD